MEEESFYRYMTDEELIKHQQRKDLSWVDIMAPYQFRRNVLTEELYQLIEKEKENNGK